MIYELTVKNLQSNYVIQQCILSYQRDRIGVAAVTRKKLGNSSDIENTGALNGIIIYIIIQQDIDCDSIAVPRMSRRCHEGKLLALVQHIGQNSDHGLTQYEFFDTSADALSGWNLSRQSGYMVIEKGGTRFHRVGHIHSIAAPVENLTFQHGLGPSVLSDIEWMPFFYHFRVKRFRDCLNRIIVLHRFEQIVGQQWSGQT